MPDDATASADPAPADPAPAGPAAVERTADGHHIVVGGRRWRATDPGVPEPLRQELVHELMAARRAVRSDPDTARPRVHDAKLALGERGEPWWDVPTPDGRRARVAAASRALGRVRGVAAQECLPDAERIVAGGQDPRE